MGVFAATQPQNEGRLTQLCPKCARKVTNVTQFFQNFTYINECQGREPTDGKGKGPVLMKRS